jgi:hypothetical protein
MQIPTHTLASQSVVSSFAVGTKATAKADKSGQQRRNKKYKANVTVSISVKLHKSKAKHFDFEAYRSLYG